MTVGPPRPVMTVVAGPPGSGKSIRFSVHDFGVDAFNVDERCRELHGGYEAIPAEVRRLAVEECERFVSEHIRGGAGFAVETTLGGRGVAVEQAVRAREAGFFTALVYVSTGDPEVSVERIRLRGLAGGHSAEPDAIRAIYRESLANFPAALLAFDRAEVYDNAGLAPRLIMRTERGRVTQAHRPVPRWVRDALAGSCLEVQLP